MSTTTAGKAPTGPALRQLVVCCDGTNNTLTGRVADTNVLWLYDHLSKQPVPAGVERLMFYDPGVGTPDSAPPTGLLDMVKRSWERAAGLASGRGVYENIADCYRFLMRNWRDGDEIYCFGFSRGSFTARCVAGMVNLFGILEPQHEALLPTLIRIYFSRPSGNETTWQGLVRGLHRRLARSHKAAAEPGGHSTSDSRQVLANQVSELFASAAGRQAWVHWIGVWDTVESVGMPGPLSRSNPSTADMITKRYRNVRHALAFDEHRYSFVHRLYEEPGDVDTAGRTLKQRWFAGVHCDVGGSYARNEAGLSDAALVWMLAEVAPALGVAPLPDSFADPAARAIRHDPMHDTPYWALAGMCLRDMRPKTAKGQAIAVIPIVPLHPHPDTVWRQRRPLWPLALALVGALLFFALMGLCMTPPDENGHRSLAVDSLGHHGVLLLQAQLRLLGGDQTARLLFLRSDQIDPGWAMLWDLGFLAGWGYLLARVASRAFTWMVGSRHPGAASPWWRVFGMAPLAVAAGDLGANVASWSAMASHWANADIVACALLSLAGLLALVKLVGLVACSLFVVVRVLIVFAGGGRVGAVGASGAGSLNGAGGTS